MNELHDLHTDAMAVEIAYRRSVLAGGNRLGERTRWWRRRELRTRPARLTH